MVIIGIYLFIIGCCLGSFINVISYRLPLNESIIYPRSSCPKCKTKINWFDNLPVISWLILKGKCRFCLNKISLFYPLVELLTGILVFLNIFAQPSLYIDLQESLIIFLSIIFTFLLITLAILDFRYFWLPKFITLGGIFMGISISVIIDLLNDVSHFNYSIYSITASLLGYIIFYLLSFIGLKIFKKPVMGAGDAKLSALIGSWLGIKGLFISIWLGFYTAGIFVILGLMFRKIKRNQKIPFGVFLASSGLIVWLFGNPSLMKIINLEF